MFKQIFASMVVLAAFSGTVIAAGTPAPNNAYVYIGWPMMAKSSGEVTLSGCGSDCAIWELPRKVSISPTPDTIIY